MDIRHQVAGVGSWFPHRLEKWENIFQSGNFEYIGKNQAILHKILEKSGNFGQFFIFAVIYLVIFHLTVFKNRTLKILKNGKNTGKVREIGQSHDLGIL